MSEPNKHLLSSILALSKEDAALARIFAEKKKIEKTVKDLAAVVQKLKGDLELKSKALNEKRFRNQRDEKILKEEREKLVLRRKTLSSLGNYKTQQAATREIETAGRDLNAHEEILLNVMAEIETLEKDELDLKEKVVTSESALKVADDDGKATLVNLEDRHKIHATERERLAKSVDATNLTLYNRIKERFPMDPAVPVKTGTCGGCYIQVVPQLVVQISKGESLVKCRGCGRILFLEETAVAA